MSLLPSRTKYRKSQRRRVRGKATRCNYVAFGDFGMQAIERGTITSAQIEAARVAINRYLKRRGKLWIRIFPHKPVTKKPAETRMGKGKGATEFWACPIKPGTILFEVTGVSMSNAREAMRLADAKLPLSTRFITRDR